MEHPILMSAPMVRALLDGTKTQTRRVLKIKGVDIHASKWVEAKYNPEYGCAFINDGIRETWDAVCPYGQIGDRLWVRETHYRYGHWNQNGFSKTGKQKWTFKAETKEVHYTDSQPPMVFGNSVKDKTGWFRRPSIFMPRWASRITLETTDIRVQRVQEISEADAIAEGLIDGLMDKDGIYTISARKQFQELWDKINGKRGYGWSVNPFVWCLTFTRVATICPEWTV